jgi:hypothetical protein
MCPKHWEMLPAQLKEGLRSGMDKGQHSLRAQPTKEWLAAVTKHVGDVKNLVIHVDAASKVKRKFQTPEPLSPEKKT